MPRWSSAVTLCVALAASACGTASSDTPPVGPPVAAVEATPETVPAPPAAPTSAPSVPARRVTEQAWIPFASVGGVTLRHPSARVERVAFHEANHDGARQLEPLPTAVQPVTLETRERLTGSHTAVDIVVDPDTEIRSPVDGTVKRAGTYVLYCEHSDDFAVIAPDDQPGWEVKILHVDGIRVTTGDRVRAGETVLAPGPTKLPFESQVDELRPTDPWPHVHVEVVDPSIPDRPSPGGGCD